MYLGHVSIPEVVYHWDIRDCRAAHRAGLEPRVPWTLGAAAQSVSQAKETFSSSCFCPSPALVIFRISPPLHVSCEAVLQ